MINSLSWLKKDNDLFLAVGGTTNESYQQGKRQELKIYRFNPIKKTLTECTTRGWSSTSGFITNVAWHPHKNYLAVAGVSPNLNEKDTAIEKNNELRIYAFDPNKEQPYDRLQGITSKPWSSQNQTINCVAWSNKGDMLAVGGNDPNENALRDVDIQNNHEIRIYSFDQNATANLTGLTSTGWPTKTSHWINTVSWSPDDHYLAAGGKCSEIIKTVHKGNSLHEFRVYQVTPEAKSQDRLLQIASKGWSTKEGEIFSISWNNDGHFIAIGGQSPDIKDEDIRINKQDELRTYYFNPTHKDYQERLIGIASKRWSTRDFPINEIKWHPTEDFLVVTGKRPDSTDNDKSVIQETAAFRFYQLTDTPPPSKVGLATKMNSYENIKTLVGISSKNWVKLGAVLQTTGWSNNGKYIAAGGQFANITDSPETIKPNHNLRIYEFNGSNLIGITSQLWSIASNGINAVAWSNNDRYLAVGGGSADNQEKIKTVEPSGNVYIYSFNPKQKNPEKRLNTMASINIGPPGSIINAISWSPDGNFLIIVGSFPQSTQQDIPFASAGLEIKVFSFNPNESSPNQRLKLTSTQSVGAATLAISWAKDKKHVAIGSANGLYIYKFDQKALTLITHMEESKAPTKVTSVAWSPDSLFLVAGGISEATGNDLFVYRFDTAKKQLKPVAQKKWSTSQEAIHSVSWNADGEFIAAGGTNAENFNKGNAANKKLRALHIYRFDRTTSTLNDIHSKEWADNGGKITSVNWSPNGEYLTVSGMNANLQDEDINIGSHHELRLYRFKKTNASFFTGATSKCWTDSIDPINSTSWNSTGNYLAVGGFKPTVKDKNETINEIDPLRIYAFDEKKSSLTAIASASLGTLKDVTSEVSAVAWHPHENTLAVTEQKITDKKVTISSTLHIYTFDPKTKVLEQTVSQPFGSNANSCINTLSWSSSGNYLAIGGVNPSSSEQNTADKNMLRIYKFNADTKQLSAYAGNAYNPGASIDSLAWVEDSGNIFLAVGGSHIDRSPSESQEKVSKDKKESTEKISVLKAYHFNPPTLTEIWHREWSTETATINSLAWSPNKMFLAAGGGTSNLDGTGIPAKRAFHLYLFDSGKKSFSGVASRQWSNNESAIEDVSWSPNNLFIAIGGQSPNLADKDKNINQSNEFRLYFFDEFNVEGLTSCDWSTLGYPLKSTQWHSSGKYIVLAGQCPTTFNSSPNNNSLQLYRFSGGDALPLTLKDALQKAPASTTEVLSRGNGEYWAVDRGSIFFFDGITWESARIDGSIKNPNHTFITEGDKNGIFALDEKGIVHKAITISTGPALIEWKPLTPIGQKVTLASLVGIADTLFGIGEDKKYYQFSESSGWKKLTTKPDQITQLTKHQSNLLNFVCTGNTSRKKGVLEGLAL